MSRSQDAALTAFESFVIAVLVTGAFFMLFDPRLHDADEPVPGWLINWPISYSLGLLAFWILTGLVFVVDAYLKRFVSDQRLPPLARRPS